MLLLCDLCASVFQNSLSNAKEKKANVGNDKPLAQGLNLLAVTNFL
jgi:hypothetical protein